MEEQIKKPTNEDLYKEQMKTLKLFLERGAISQAQYDKSAGDLTEKMKIKNQK